MDPLQDVELEKMVLPCHVDPEIFSALGLNREIFLFEMGNSIWAFRSASPIPKSWPLSCCIIINGILRSSRTFSAALFFPAEIKQKESFSFLAMQAKELSTHSLALPKDVCPWWVYRIYVYLIRMFVVEKKMGIFIMFMGRLVLGFVIECRIWRSITRSQGSQQPPQFLHLRCCKDCHSTASGSSPHLVFTFFT